jgi:hypothetical protein
MMATADAPKIRVAPAMEIAVTKPRPGCSIDGTSGSALDFLLR